MCLINSNIIEIENKEVKRNSDLTYEERCKIEFMVKKKYTMQEMSEELGRNKSIISREINRHYEEKWDYNTGICKKVYSATVAQGKYEYSKKKAGRKSKLSSRRNTGFGKKRQQVKVKNKSWIISLKILVLLKNKLN